MKKLTAFLLFFLLVSPANAGPVEWIKHHKRFLLMEGAAIAAVSIHAAGLHHCRVLNGVEPCDEHYGAAWAQFGILSGMTIVVMPTIAEGCWKGGHGHFCDTLAYGGSAFQASWGVREWRIHSPEIAKEPTACFNSKFPEFACK
jgi:hypothetical protein